MICQLLLGLPAMTMEFAMGRASQASPIRMYQKLEKPGQKWHIHGYFALPGNLALMALPPLAGIDRILLKTGALP